MKRKEPLGMLPTISVIIPTCDRAHLLSRALNSVFAQSYGDYEIIAVDDHSADDTLEVIKRFSDSRLKCVPRKERGGGAVARNSGLAVAKGKYIAFLDDDDEWLPEKLKHQIEVLDTKPEVGMVYTGVRHINQQNGLIIKTYQPEKRGRLFKILLAENFIGTTSSVMMRREALEHCGYFDPDLPSCQDWDIYLHLARYFDIDFVAEPLVNFYIHPVRITRNLDAKIRGRERILAKYRPDMEGDRQLLSRHYTVLGKLYCHAGRFQEGRAALLKAVRKRPWNLSTYKYLLPALLGGTFYRAFLDCKQQMIQFLFKKHRLQGERIPDDE